MRLIAWADAGLILAKKKERDPTLDPSLPSDVYRRMAPKWKLVGTLLAGTSAMRKAGEEYLPEHDAESPAAYNERLTRCTLYNMFELTLDSLVGKVFVEPLIFSDDVPDPIKKLYPDADLMGNDASVFARHTFRKALAKKKAYVLVDMPSISPEERAQLSREDDLKRRPYWSLIDPENIIFMYSEVVAGRKVLKQVRILETECVLDGFAEKIKTQIRVLTPGNWELYQKQDEEDPDSEWLRTGGGTYDLDEIPLWEFDAGDPVDEKLPLEDLAYLNVRHWQSTSDQISILTVTRFPMLACSGATGDNGALMKVGPRQLLGIREPNGKFYYVEHNGKSIEAGAKDLQDLEEKMAAYGAEFLRRKLAGVTATERALDLAETMSVLRDIAYRFVAAFAQLLALTGKWLKISGPCGSVKVNTDFIERAEDDIDLQILNAAFVEGAIDAATYVFELIRHDVLSPETNVAQVVAKAAKERAQRAADAAATKQAQNPAAVGSLGSSRGNVGQEKGE